MSNITAVDDKIIAIPIEQERKTPGGLVVPESAGQLPQEAGRVISVGEKVVNVKEGDVIYYHQRAGQVIMLDYEGQILKVVKYDEIYGYTSGNEQ